MSQAINKAMDLEYLLMPAGQRIVVEMSGIYPLFRSLQLVRSEMFENNGKSCFVWPDNPSKRYTFGAVFLRKSG